MHRLLSTAVPLPAPPVEANLYAEGYAAGRLEERAAVIAWLRAAAAGASPGRQREAGTLAAAAEILARGGHIADLA